MFSCELDWKLMPRISFFFSGFGVDMLGDVINRVFVRVCLRSSKVWTPRVRKQKLTLLLM